ncbi:hypothetical protein Tco_1579406, partial [Tanacetum coccineum]
SFCMLVILDLDLYLDIFVFNLDILVFSLEIILDTSLHLQLDLLAIIYSMFFKEDLVYQSIRKYIIEVHSFLQLLIDALNISLSLEYEHVALAMLGWV